MDKIDKGIEDTVKMWMENENLQKFIQQAHTDMSIGASKGFGWTINGRVDAFLKAFENQLRPTFYKH